MTRVERRAFLVGTLGLLVAPPPVQAQQAGKAARIGLLYGATAAFSPDSDSLDRALAAGLRDQGYVVGQNLMIEFRSARGQFNRFPSLAAELVGLGVDVILTGDENGVKAVQAASRSIPIVMMGASVDPVAAGLVASLARPGGSITGVTIGDLAGKRMELLKEMLPRLRSVALFHRDPSAPFVARQLRATEVAARRLQLSLHPVPLLGSDPAPWAQAFETVARRGIEAAMIHEAPSFEAHRQILADLALKHRVPMAWSFRTQAEAGGLMSYAVDFVALLRRAGNLTGRILQGAKPADLPIEQPTKFELIINLKTAKALGLTIPPSVLARADEVIQ